MLFGLGHSTHPQSDFVDICKTANLDVIVDTRSHPGSSANPQYNREEMEKWLPAAGIEYQWWPELGGWDNRHAPLAKQFGAFGVDVDVYCHSVFPKQRIAKKRDKPGFFNFGFYDYSFFMSLPEFMGGVDRLLALDQSKRYALICCEACWVRCHRSMIADYLVWRGSDMTHLTPRFRKKKLPRTVVAEKAHSQVIGDRLTRYDPYILGCWGSPAHVS